MISKREYIFGGLKVEIYVHPEFGSVTTTKEFADIVGSTDRHVRRLLAKHKLIDENLAAEDKEFRTKMSETMSKDKGGRPSSVLLTVKGMIFLTMLLRTERALAFKNEVLATIEQLETRGLPGLDAVTAELDRIKTIVKDQGESILKLTTQN